ncbi:MAG: hypothetical protein MUP47_06280, partial [Phycisphaerae bacterium]|nr:hypothetical protein [Phycisphaerae bacterium]
MLELIRLREHCAGIGELMPTGSYFLDLMMYPDIDIYLPPASVQGMMALGARLAEYECVKELKLDKGWAEENEDLAGGLYLKAVVAHGHWERRWKIDIWSLPTAISAKKQQELVDLKGR